MVKRGWDDDDGSSPSSSLAPPPPPRSSRSSYPPPPRWSDFTCSNKSAHPLTAADRRLRNYVGGGKQNSERRLDEDE